MDRSATPSQPAAWDAFFSDFYLRAYASASARTRCRRKLGDPRLVIAAER